MYDNCPYCDAEVDICHDDGYGMDESGTFKQKCGSCGKTFAYTTEFSIDHELFKADCLNGIAPHDWKRTRTHKKEYTDMECRVCGIRRLPTDEEKAAIMAEI